MDFKKARFIKTVTDPDDLKQGRLPEIAIVGRSNVGKSSLINYLTGLKIARVSRMPGKTQALQYFEIDNRLILVDLPGWGFADVPEELRREWSDLMETYLNDSSQLRCLLLLLDVRREPGREEKQMLMWAEAKRMPVILVFTKMDKCGDQEGRKQIQEALSHLRAFHLPMVAVSSSQRLGGQSLVAAVQEVIK